MVKGRNRAISSTWLSLDSLTSHWSLAVEQGHTVWDLRPLWDYCPEPLWHLPTTRWAATLCDSRGLLTYIWTSDAAERNQPAPNAEAAQNRRNLLDGRLGKTTNIPPGPSTPESELTALRTNTGAPGNFSISHEVRLSNKAGSVDKVLGKGCYCYSENLMMHGTPSFNYGCTPQFDSTHAVFFLI